MEKKPVNFGPNTHWKYLFKEVGARTAARKSRKGICKHWGCQNVARQGRRDCETCKGRKTTIKNPERYVWREIKKSAKKRNISFELTFEQFLDFDRQTSYVASRGKESESLTIDRIDSSKGYQVDNIRALTWLENCSQKVEGMTEPIDPIAKALCLASGGGNWHKFKMQAVEVLQMVETLQVQQEGGFEPELIDDPCPF